MGFERCLSHFCPYLFHFSIPSQKPSRLCENANFSAGADSFWRVCPLEGASSGACTILPARVDDYVDRDNPVRFIDAFVEDLDLNEAGFARVAPKDTGRPAYDPADLLKLYIYGYINRVRPSR